MGSQGVSRQVESGQANNQALLRPYGLRRIVSFKATWVLARRAAAAHRSRVRILLGVLGVEEDLQGGGRLADLPGKREGRPQKTCQR